MGYIEGYNPLTNLERKVIPGLFNTWIQGSLGIHVAAVQGDRNSLLRGGGANVKEM